jgi:ankyrin repeat protein
MDAVATAAVPSAPVAAAVGASLSEEDQLEVLECARYGETDDLRALLDAGADANFRDAGGNTALHRAAGNGHTDAASLLIQRGALFVPNANGNTPLHWAALNGHAAIVTMLLERFEDCDALAMNAFGKSALTDAINGGHDDIARIILSHRSADPAAAKGGAGGSDGGEDDDAMDEGDGADEGDGGDEEEGEDDEADAVGDNDEGMQRDLEGLDVAGAPAGAQAAGGSGGAAGTGGL